jgi:hypothetical protein
MVSSVVFVDFLVELAEKAAFGGRAQIAPGRKTIMKSMI